VVLDADLRERDAGEWTGLTRAEIERRYPEFLPDGRRPAGWESDELLVERAQRALWRIADATQGGDVLVITHAGVVFAVERHLGLDRTRLANVEGRWVTVAPEGLRLGVRLLLAEPQDVTVPRQM
jgi:broad specificity phosphatase PhoE